MVRIYIRERNKLTGHIFKSKTTIASDTIRMLPYTFVLAGLISESEFYNSQEPIRDKFDFYTAETKIDGRCKIAKSMKYFSWREVLNVDNRLKGRK